ncbi:MAG: hypothetical protein JNM69_11450 [Archangium sp.]|nr:hypothetical protein [Archangium sp.]
MNRSSLLVFFVLSACGSGQVAIRDPDMRAGGGGSAGSSASSAGGTVVTAGGTAGGSIVTGGGTAGGVVTAGGASSGGGGFVELVDEATLVSTTLPTSLPCSQLVTARVTLRNTGTTTWTAAQGYKLGAVGDSDPFGPGRITLPVTASVAPGQTYDFEVPLQAPSGSTTGTSDWRMVRENVRWFGDVVSSSVSVSCGPPSFDLSTVIIQGAPIGAPDVRSFAVTSTITDFGFRPDTMFIDHTRRGQWPPVVIAPDGTTQEATVWIFFRIGGVWYGTGGERLRPNQTQKQLTKVSDIGPGWLYDPNRWGPMTNYVPAVGDYVGVMVVAGSTRSDANSPVQERTKVSLFQWPADYQDVSFPPFAWTEP